MYCLYNLGKNFFGIWRQSLDKKQSIFSVTNVTNIFQYLDLTELNLIESEKWWDLISSKDINDIKNLQEKTKLIINFLKWVKKSYILTYLVMLNH